MRSQSPLSQFPDKQGAPKAKTHSGLTGSAAGGTLYQSSLVGLGAEGPSSSAYMGHANTPGIVQSSNKINSYSGASTSTGSQAQYRGYSPSKPKWKATNLGMPQTNNLVGASSGLSHNQMISHVQGFSASGGGMALRSKNKQ